MIAAGAGGRGVREGAGGVGQGGAAPVGVRGRESCLETASPTRLPYGKNRADNRHLRKETGILD